MSERYFQTKENDLTEQNKLYQALFSGFNAKRIFFNQSLKNFTTFHCGGNADILFLPEQIEEIESAVEICRKHQIPYQIIGRGSNVLISDRGVRGLTIYLSRFFNHIHYQNNKITADCGVSLTALVALAAKHSLTGMEFACGIPGSLGGAVLMNASAYDGEMKNLVVSSLCLMPDGEIRRLAGAEHEFAYRQSVYSRNEAIILRAELEFKQGNRQEIYQKINEFQIKRRSSQPLGFHSAGSAFKRPPGYFAGKLITDAGLKGFRMEHAGVSAKHAGFIVNYGEATASEINQVFAHVKSEVSKQFGVSLEPEVKFIGDWKAEELAWKL